MAPQTKLAARTPEYLARYGRTLNAAYRFERIQREIADEQGRVQYLDSLIGQERQTLAGLQQVFRAEPLSFGAAQELLAQVSGAERAGALAGAQAAATRKAATSLTKDERASLETAKAESNQSLYSTAEALLTGATPEKAKAILAQVSRLPEADKTALASYARKFSTGKVPSGAAAPQGAAVAEALEAAFFAGPTGIRGGYEGMAVVERRKLTADQLEAKGMAAEADALRKSGFATQEDALNAALEQVRLTGDPNAVDNTFARDLYVEARNAEAYTNAQRADFEQEVLDSRKRLAKLEGERQKIAGRYDDPVQEAIKRELTARGYKFAERGSADEWKNKYVQYQNTPLYDVLLSADRLVDTAKNTGKPLAPSTKAQNMVTTLAMQYERSETPFDLNTLRTQLEKAPDLSKKDVDDALSFIVAYRELGGEKQDPDSIAFLKRQDELQKQEDEARRAQAEAMKAEVERARAVTRQLEAEQVKAVSELRTEQKVANLGPAEYARLRAMGMSPEEARAKAMRVVPAEAPQTSQAAAKVLMEPDLLMERQRRVEAARKVVPIAPLLFEEEPAIELPPQRLDLTEEAAPADAKSVSRPSLDRTIQRLTRLASAQSVAPETLDLAKSAKEFRDTMEKARNLAPKKPTPKPAAPKAPAPTPAPAKPMSEAAQLKKMLTDGTIKPGTSQYNAALDRLDVLEGR